MAWYHTCFAVTAAAALACAHASVVTTPSGIFTNPGALNAGDAIAPDVWLRVNVRNDGAVGITNTYPRNGGGSVFLSLGANTGNNGKADWEFYPFAGFGRLNAMSSLIYEWYRDGSSNAAPHLHPVIRLFIDADGDPSTTADRGYLVFERCYNVVGCPAVPTNAWTSEAIVGGTNLWWVQFGVGIDTIYNRPLSTYQSGGYAPTAGFAQITGNSLILGVSVGIGSGWSAASGAAFVGAADSVTITSSTPGAVSLTNTNFELTAAASSSTAVSTLPHSAAVFLRRSCVRLRCATRCVRARRISRPPLRCTPHTRVFSPLLLGTTEFIVISMV